MLPELNTITAKDEIISRFLGLNQKDSSNTESFKDMLNMTSDEYPYLSPRVKSAIREVYNGAYRTILGSVIYGEDIYTVQGYVSSGTANVKFFKNFEEVSGVTLQANMKDRQLKVYGAYIYIFPDNILYNTEKNESQSASYELEVPGVVPTNYVATSELYLSDKNGVPYQCNPLYNQYLAWGLQHTLKECDTEITSMIRTHDELKNQCYELSMKQITYEDGTTDSIYPKRVLISRKDYVRNYSGNTSYDISFLNKNSNGELSVYKYNQSQSAFLPEETYVTLIIKNNSITDKIKTGDFVKIQGLKADGSEYKESDFAGNEKLWNLINKLQSGIKVENAFFTTSYSYLVFSNNSLDLLNVYKTYNNKFKYGKYPDDGVNPSQYFSEIIKVDNRLGFGWLNNPGSAVDHIKVKKEAPEMDYITVSANRIWGCSSNNHEIYACKQGDATSWYNYSGLSSDSYAVTIPSGDPFTGAVTYNDMPYFFTENMAYAIMGNKPKNYQVQNFVLRGVENGAYKTIAQKDGYVYYKSKSGIERFNGNNAQSITEYLDIEGLKGIFGATNNDKYFVYLGLADDATVYVYDIKKRQWHKERKDLLATMIELDNNLYVIKSNSLIATSLIRINGKSNEVAPIFETTPTYDTVKWFVESGEFNGNLILNKYVTKFMFELKIEEGAKLAISFMYDDSGEWEKVFKTTDDHTKRLIKVPILTRRCERMRYKIEGKGQAKVYSIVITYEGGTENG